MTMRDPGAAAVGPSSMLAARAAWGRPCGDDGSDGGDDAGGGGRTSVDPVDPGRAHGSAASPALASAVDMSKPPPPTLGVGSPAPPLFDSPSFATGGASVSASAS